MDFGSRDDEADGVAVERVVIWYSARRRRWCIERLDADGHQVGFAHMCIDEHEARDCHGTWLRLHADAEALHIDIERIEERAASANKRAA